MLRWLSVNRRWSLQVRHAGRDRRTPPVLGDVWSPQRNRSALPPRRSRRRVHPRSAPQFRSPLRDMGRVLPWEWEQFIGAVPAVQWTGDLSAAYARLLTDPDPEVCTQAVRQWCAWRTRTCHWRRGGPPTSVTGLRSSTDLRTAGYALLEPGLFLRRGQSRAHMHRLADISVVLIHGRYDVSGPWTRMAPAPCLAEQTNSSCSTTPATGGASFTSELVGALNSFRTLR